MIRQPRDEWHFTGAKATYGVFGNNDAIEGQSVIPPFTTDLTDATHGLLAGSDKNPSLIWIEGTTNYDGLRKIVSIPDVNSIMIAASYVAEELAGTAPVMPDQEVYCKGPALWLELPPDVEEIQDAAAGLVKQNQAGTDTPRCVVADGVGLFAVGASDKLADSALATMGAMLETLTVAGCFGGARGLKAENLEFLRHWEVVKYREELVSDSGKKT